MRARKLNFKNKKNGLAKSGGDGPSQDLAAKLGKVPKI
jgi:hypothetical protein